MADAPANAPQIQGNLPLYKKPEPLNLQAHKNLGLKYGDRPFDFLKDTHFVPVTMGEMGRAGTCYPIIFIGEAKIPVAVMGLQQGHNVFVDPETGQFEQDCYLPAYIRRYPFVAATHPDEKERFTVCVDAGSHLISDKPDQPFFTEDGQATEFLNGAIDFVQRFESDVAATNTLIERLNELGLFEQQQTNWTPRDQRGQPQGDPVMLATYWGISTEKFRALDGETLANLRDSGVLGAIYAHMLSQSQWDMVVARANRRGLNPAARPQAASDAPPPPPQA
jgi:hypothetical protein